MQDGRFKDGDRLHATGKALLVFAGGTADKFEQFTEDMVKAPDSSRTAKLPDFVSRLSGFVNVKGINGSATATPDQPTRLRRAILLRLKLENWHPGLLDRNKSFRSTHPLSPPFWGSQPTTMARVLWRRSCV